MRTYENVDLSIYSKWKVGGFVKKLIVVESKAELIDIVNYCTENSINYIVIGNTTNLLFTDERIDGVLICLAGEFNKITRTNDTLKVGAGCFVPSLVRYCCNNGLSGIEHLIGVPATVGGALYMNAGSQRKCIGTNVERVYIYSPTEGLKVIDKNDCKFSYRSSIFHDREKKYVILGVELKLAIDESKLIRRRCLKILRERNLKFPRKQASCGSVFISDPKLYHEVGPPGAIIESIGMKGVVVGGAQVSPIHANFIVNRSNASFYDVLNLVKEIQNKVEINFGCELRAEFRIINSKCETIDPNKYNLS